jgi:6-phosphofructokinase 1
VGRRRFRLPRRRSGLMSTILRSRSDLCSPLRSRPNLVANSERSFPRLGLRRTGATTDDFVRYAGPLIGADWPSIPLVDGRQRFSRLAPIFATQQLPAYVPQAFRG